jgi:hypothetical protein
MADKTATSSGRRKAIILALLAAASFLLYAAGVLMLHQDRAPGWSLEADGPIPAAVSYLIYGTPLGAVERDVRRKFNLRGGISVQDVLAMAASKSIPPGPVDSTTIDGGGAGAGVFATIAMGLFGLKISSLVELYLLMTGVSAAAFALRFRDRRLLVLPLYFLVATAMLLTWLGTSKYAVDQVPIGGLRYFVMATFLPALHIFFEIVDGNAAAAGWQRIIANALLLLLQALLLFGVLLARSSAGYVLGVLFALWIWRFYRERRRPAQRSALLRDGAVVAGAFGIWCMIVVTALPAYLQTGRLLGNFWHRAFASFVFHPDWPFGDLRQVYDCTRYFPEGLNRHAMDRNGHCVWWLYPANADRAPDAVAAGIYDGEYEKAVRQAYFYVITHYPRQTFELYAFYKSALIANTMTAAWDALFELPHAPVANALLVVALAQLMVFIAFVIAVALIERTVVDLPFAIFPLLFMASVPPLYVAWSSLWTSTYFVFLMYSCLVLAAVLLVQVLGLAVLRRAPTPPAASSEPAGN